MQISRVFIGLMLLSLPFRVLSQVNADQYQLDIKAVTDVITLDGNLEEQTWQKADVASDFILAFPNDSLPPINQTEVMIAYDQNNIYIAGVCYTNTDKEHIVESLRRDFSFGSNDNLSIYIDPYNDYTNGFTFGITPYGVQREGLLTNGQNVSTDWDNKWFSEVENYEDRWQFEIKIPFKTLRYDDQNTNWNLIFLRKDAKNNEESVWSPVPLGYRKSSMAFAGRGNLDGKLKKAGANVVLIPFVTAGANKNYETDEQNDNLSTGFDAKIGISSSLNLDLTYNPDFSQVEVDRQVTNLSRFELFFPERRQFFLENQDLFQQGGFRESRPFFSRRIGIAQDTAGNRLQVPIQYGARLSGKIGQDWRVGFLNMQTKQTNTAVLPGADNPEGTYNLLAQNYTVGIIQRRVFSRSNINLTAVNRQALDYKANESTSSSTEYNRLLGVDYNLLSADGSWEGDFFYYQSFDPVRKDDAFATGAFLGYNNRNLSLRFIGSAVGNGYNAETGFVQRRDIIRLSTFGDYNFYPKNSFLVSHGPGMDISYRTDMNWEVTDRSFRIDYEFNHKNTSRLQFRLNRDFVRLRSEFDPTRMLPDSLSDRQLQPEDKFTWNTFSMSYRSDRRRKISLEADFNDGGFYNGRRFNARAQLNMRYQPYGIVALSVDYNNLYSFPEPFTETEFWLIGPRIDFTFTDKLFLTTFVQYNEQADNVNLNTRFQWRFKPVSDLFVVYTDNYFPDSFTTKSRAIVFKITYWLNV